MIEIKINKKDESINLIKPSEMINSKYGTVFQEFFKNKQGNSFFISCGIGEKSIIHIWYNDENKRYELSTDDKESLKQFVESYKVFEIDAIISIDMNINNND